MRVNLHDYQHSAASFCEGRYLCGEKGSGIFGDPGVGKTLITLELIRRMGFDRTLILAPRRVRDLVWPKQVEQWGFDFDVSVVSGSPKTRRNKLHRQANLFPMTSESAMWLAEQDARFDFVVVDESTKFKNWNAKRTKALRKIVRDIPNRLILTGTPAPNSVMDLHPQCYLLDDGETLGRTKTMFCAKYMQRGGFQGRGWVPGDGAAAAIEQDIAHMVFRLDAGDYLDMPPILFNDIEVELPTKAFKDYKKFERELFIELAGGSDLTASNAGAKYAMCRQIANGAIYDVAAEEKPIRTASTVHNAKIEALEELVGELNGKPLLVAIQFRHDAWRIAERFPDAPIIAGGTSDREADEIVEAWNRGELPLVLAQTQALSHGLNLQAAANDIAWFGLTDNLETYLQFNARLHRQGVTGQVRVHRLLARGTVDNAIAMRIANKDLCQSTLLDALNAYRRSQES